MNGSRVFRVFGLWAAAAMVTAIGCDPPDPFFFLDDEPAVENVDDAGQTNDNAAPDDTVTDQPPDDPGVDDNANDNANDMPPGDDGGSIVDSDGDGFSDEEERNALPGSNPLNPADTPLNPIDSDGDGCSDFDETTFVGFCDGNPNTVDPGTLADPGTAFTFSLSVARHVDVPFTDAQVDVVFDAGGELLQTVQSECPDLATNTTFVRDGSVTTFDVADSFLTVESQLDQVFEVPQEVKVVDMMVGVCGVPQADDMSVVLGCAFTGGSLVITATAAPDVWVHEWGHVQGLLHRDDCPRNIMHSIEVDTNAVNAQERVAFLTDTPRLGKTGTMDVSIAGDAAFAADQTVDRTMRLRRAAEETQVDWLHRVAEVDYLAGFPAELMQDAEVDSAGHLLDMLRSRAPRVRLRNVARMMGLTADASVCAGLMDWATGRSGALGFDEAAAVVEAILAVGRLSAGDSTGAAMQWLMDGCDPATWAARGVDWRYGSRSVEAVRRLLARVSILSLGLTGREAALDHLRSLPGGDFGSEIEAAAARLTGGENAQRAKVSVLKQP